MERQTRFDSYRSDPEADDPMCLEGLEELDPEDAEAVKKILKDATNDAVHHPNHYQIADGVEVIDVIKHILMRSEFTGFQGYCLGNVVKYILRADLKNGREDYQKAQEYLGWLIQDMSEDTREWKCYDKRND